MEGLNDKSDDDSKKKESPRKSTKLAEKIGTSLIEPQTKRLKTESIFSKVLDKSSEKTKSKPEIEASKAETKLGELTPDEVKFARKELLPTLPAIADQAETQSDPGQLAEDLASLEFRRLVDEEVEPDDAEKLIADKLEPASAEQDSPQEFNQNEGIINLSSSEDQVPDEEDDDGSQQLQPDNPMSQGPGSPTPPNQPPAPPFNQPPNQPPQGPGPQPNVLNALPLAGPNVLSTPGTTTTEYHDNSAGAFIIGGILGYLIGRRRGRIKTEKKLLPIQKKLTKEVEQLQVDLRLKEAKVRQLARQQYEKQGAAVIAKLEQQLGLKSKAEVIGTPLTRRAPEHIGHVLINADEGPSEIKPKSKETKLSAREIESQVIDLNHQELLAVASKIGVENSDLRKIYDTNLISEKGLRRLVTEYLRGGDIKKALKRELIEREIDFERDPILRDKKPQASVQGGGATTLRGLLSTAESVSSDLLKDELNLLKDQGANEQKRGLKASQRRHLADIGLVGTILLLIILVGVLLLTRH